MLRRLYQFFYRYFVCEHHNRILNMIVREPVTYTRRAQYYCPTCQHCWCTPKLPEGI